MRSVPCPCCGHPVPDDDFGGIRLTPMTRRILDYVSRRSPAGVPLRQLVDHVYAGREDGGPDSADTVTRTQVHHLNKLLRPYGVLVRHDRLEAGYVLLRREGPHEPRELTPRARART